MPFRVHEVPKKQLKKIFPHVEVKKGERMWTSHVFEARDDLHPKNSDRNFICKFLAKEKKNGKLAIVVVWEYPRAGYFRKYAIGDCTKERYDDIVSRIGQEFEVDQNIHHEVLYPQQFEDQI